MFLRKVRGISSIGQNPCRSAQQPGSSLPSLCIAVDAIVGQQGVSSNASVSVPFPSTGGFTCDLQELWDRRSEFWCLDATPYYLQEVNAQRETYTIFARRLAGYAAKIRFSAKKTSKRAPR